MAPVKKDTKQQIIEWAIKNPEQLTDFIKKLLCELEAEELQNKLLIEKYNKKNQYLIFLIFSYIFNKLLQYKVKYNE